MIGVLNMAHGGSEKLPFNFRHARHPHLYRLEPGSSGEERKAQKLDLARRLAEAIQTILGSGVLAGTELKPEQFVATPSTSSPANFLQHGEAFATLDIPGRPSLIVKSPDGPSLFLRLIPSSKTEPLTSVEASDIVKSSGIMPLYWGDRITSTMRETGMARRTLR
jgi:hypothetical protein